ncbi:hypothetical protein [Pararcticibacter amylolyticus]|uniref:tRNA (Guanine-N1)-methyltransferase n=1 Tax=Pararcticibacter amylolyticus TaxID=2173175 RepID=A0A2U2PBD3_9SPHI|nr:hypothetical protein [Pararcticibacter amylolyticus]PWG78670.1 hypothetical protein DDR33_20800 [Pararcticibacter amylolyticus]
MKRYFLISLITLITTTSSGYLFAQDSTARKNATLSRTPAGPPADPSLQGQYQEMLMRSRTQDGYKLINPYRLTTLWKNSMDSLRAEKKRRIEAEKRISSSAESVSAMRDSLSKNQESLDQSQEMIDSISLLGMKINKTLYNSIMWGIVLVLALALAIVLFLSGKNRREAAYRIKLFEELSAEFQTYKSKANEREKKLARELQDERNKLDDLTNGK